MSLVMKVKPDRKIAIDQIILARQFLRDLEIAWESAELNSVGKLVHFEEAMLEFRQAWYDAAKNPPMSMTQERVG